MSRSLDDQLKLFTQPPSTSIPSPCSTSRMRLVPTEHLGARKLRTQGAVTPPNRSALLCRLSDAKICACDGEATRNKSLQHREQPSDVHTEVSRNTQWRGWWSALRRRRCLGTTTGLVVSTQLYRTYFVLFLLTGLVMQSPVSGHTAQVLPF